VHVGWTPIRIAISSDGTFGTSFGWLDATAPDAAGSSARQHGKYINIWRLVAGRWQLAAHFRNGLRAIDPAAPPATYPLLADEGPRRCPAAAGPDADLRAILDTDRAFAAKAVAHGRADAFHEYAAEDAVSLPGGQIPYGRQAIFASDTADTEPGESLEWTPLSGGVAPSGDLGYSVGEAVYGAGGQRVYLKYLTVWRKQEGGSFRYIADGGTTRPAPAAP
jgi:ketosteroid isomerase-like protein